MIDLQPAKNDLQTSPTYTIPPVVPLAAERIERLVFLDALVPQPGESVVDIVQRRPNATPYEMTEFTRGPSRESLANGLIES